MLPSCDARLRILGILLGHGAHRLDAALVEPRRPAAAPLLPGRRACCGRGRRAVRALPVACWLPSIQPTMSPKRLPAMANTNDSAFIDAWTTVLQHSEYQRPSRASPPAPGPGPGRPRAGSCRARATLLRRCSRGRRRRLTSSLMRAQGIRIFRARREPHRRDRRASSSTPRRCARRGSRATAKSARRARTAASSAAASAARLAPSDAPTSAMRAGTYTGTCRQPVERRLHVANHRPAASRRCRLTGRGRADRSRGRVMPASCSRSATCAHSSFERPSMCTSTTPGAGRWRPRTTSRQAACRRWR